MDVELQINNSPSGNARFLTWAPSPCRIRVTNPSGAPDRPPMSGSTGVSTATGGAVVFRAGPYGGIRQQRDACTVPINGSSVPFFAAGRFGRPSVSNW